MSNLLDLLQGQLNDDNFVGQLSQQLGGVDRQQTALAAQGVVSTLLGALSRNAATPEGAHGLANALERDHDGSILDNVIGFLGGQVQPQNPRTANGAGILEHILGNRQNSAIDMISQMSGLDQNKTGNLMSMLAPVVMGMLGRQKREQGLDVGGLVSLLNNSTSGQRQQGNPLMNMVTRFLDKDGDGSALDDIAGMIGKNLFGNLFGGRK